MDLSSILIVVLCLVAYFYLWSLIGSQKERRLSSKEEIYEAMKNDVYQKSTSTLNVVAGEANIEIYSVLCDIVHEKIKDHSLKFATFMLGPIVSTWESNKTLLDSANQIKCEARQSGEFLKILNLSYRLL